MTAPIELVVRERQPALAVAVRCNILMIPRAMGRSFHLIDAVMKARGLQMQAAPYALYKNVDWATAGQAKGLKALLQMFTHKWQMEIGIPVASDSNGEGEVIASEIPAGRYLRTVHKGPYRTMNQSYQRMQAYASEAGLSLADYALEVYLNDPGQVSKGETQTELLVALRG